MRKSLSRKAAAILWYKCELCDLHITTKEREAHENVCPISDAEGLTFEYIKNGIFYTGGMEPLTFEIDELSDMPQKYVNQLIYISEGAIRLAQFHIGQNVVIDAPEVVPLVKKVWPIPEKFLTQIFVGAEDFELYWKELKNKRFSIRALSSDNIVIASYLKLELIKTATPKQTQLIAQQLRDLVRLLKQEIKHCIYARGSRIHFNFFNKMLQFRVVSVWSTNMEETLEAAMQEMVIHEEDGRSRFFQVTLTTRLYIDDGSPRDTDENTDVFADERNTAITRADIGGLDDQLNTIEQSMDIALGLKETPKGVRVSRSLLLYGTTGCGKTLICEAMCNRLKHVVATSKPNCIQINASAVFSKFLGETEKNLIAYFERAYREYPRPTLIIIEGVHNLCPKYETNEIIKRVSVAFLSMLDTLHHKIEAQNTLLLATTTNIEALSVGARRCGRFANEVEISVPTPKARADILRCLLRKVDHNLCADDIESIANITHGFVGADLANLIYSASLSTLKEEKKQQTCLQAAHIHNCLTHVKPSAMREILIENPKVRWADIGGQQRLKLQLQQAIEWPILYADKFKRLGIKAPRGLLMYGPPGCSKTMIAKALATESRLNFLSIKGPELFSMWVGESERAVREVFRKARQVAPAIVFFDEIDAISSERSDAAAGSTVKERVLTQLLTEMDGVEALQNVTIVAATNRPDMIDKALLRPGRIDRIVYVGLPDEATRREILNIQLKVMPLAANVDIELLVTATKGYTGAELQAVCHEAALKAIELSFDSTEVSWTEFEYALSVVKPRTSPELLRIYSEYRC